MEVSLAESVPRNTRQKYRKSSRIAINFQTPSSVGRSCPIRYHHKSIRTKVHLGRQLDNLETYRRNSLTTLFLVNTAVQRIPDTTPPDGILRKPIGVVFARILAFLLA